MYVQWKTIYEGGYFMKKFAKILAFLSIAALFTAGAALAAPMQLTMGTGGTAGTYYPLGGALSQIISDNSGGVVNITAQSTGASIENINLLAAGDVDLIIVQNDMSDYAYNGTEFFKDRKIENITAIARLYPEHIQVIASKESGIKTIADFKGKSISVGAREAETKPTCARFLTLTALRTMISSPISFPTPRQPTISRIVSWMPSPIPQVLPILQFRISAPFRILYSFPSTAR